MGKLQYTDIYSNRLHMIYTLNYMQSYVLPLDKRGIKLDTPQALTLGQLQCPPWFSPPSLWRWQLDLSLNVTSDCSRFCAFGVVMHPGSCRPRGCFKVTAGEPRDENMLPGHAAHVFPQGPILRRPCKVQNGKCRYNR
jgi:hypothetical protein